MPVISVIVPVYNVEKYLQRCVDSILAQTFTDFEILLIDDGSTDKSGTLCDEYAIKDRRVKAIHKVNGGVSSARNVGLKSAKGEFVMFLDSDDYWEKDWIEKLYNPLMDSKADVINAGYSLEDEAGNITQLIRFESVERTIDSEKDIIDLLIMDIIGNRIGWSAWTRIFKMQIIREHKLAFSLKCDNFAEDMGFVLAYSLFCKKIRCISEIGYHYVRHTGSMMDRSAETAKLNAVNEVSLYLSQYFFDIIHTLKNRKQFAIIHYLIMRDQYYKVPLFGTEYKNVRKIEPMITNLFWHDKWMKRLVFCYRELKDFYGREEAVKMILTSRQVSFRSWRRFAAESAIVYKLILK